MDKFIKRPSEFYSTFKSLDKQLGYHGLETEETIKLRGKIREFFEYHISAISQELGTTNFSVMAGGSLQAGTADRHSDIDLTIILDKGDTNKIWTKGGIGETNDDIARIFSPQLYQTVNIDDFRRLIIEKLTSISGGVKIWDQKIVIQLRAILIERVGDEKGISWPEREGRDLTESQKKNNLTKIISNKLKGIEIPNFQEMRILYGV